MQRFIIIEQKKPTQWLTIMLTNTDGEPYMHSMPLKYELIDRGENFVVGDEKSVNDNNNVLARFTSLDGSGSVVFPIARQPQTRG